MISKRFLTVLCLTCLRAAHGQPVSFDTATIRVSPVGAKGGEGENLTVNPGGVSMRNVSLRFCVQWAYELKPFQLGTPGWMESDRYDIVAKSAGPVAVEQLRRMMQALLAERFKLTLHHETKEMSMYALVAGKKPKLQPAKGEGPGVMKPNGGALEFRNMTMGELAERLPARPFGIGRPVVDQTELPGRYDFDWKLADNMVELKSNLEKRELEGDTSMFATALSSLGLKLETQKGPVDTVVVDHAEKVPVEN
jgi:uncharacterized protein (TIGR03435 family)